VTDRNAGQLTRSDVQSPEEFAEMAAVPPNCVVT
jgi:hypothetical protein